MTAVVDNSIPAKPSSSSSMTVKGAVLGGTGCWLLMLVPATEHLISQYMHPMVLLFFAICVPVSGFAGTIAGGISGWLVSKVTRRWTQLSANETPPAQSNGAHFILGGIFAIIAGTLVAATTIFVSLAIENRPIAAVESVGGSYERRDASITFAPGHLTNQELNEIVTAMNGFYWNYLDLSGTNVTSDGLHHLREIEGAEWTLALSTEQIDANAIRHLSELKGLQTLDIKGDSVTPERLNEIVRLLPGVYVLHNGHLVAQQ